MSSWWCTSAHEFSTSLEHFHRILALLEGHRDLGRRIKRVSRSHGDEGIELTTGQRIRFRTRTKGGGRGFSADLVVCDEAMVLPEASLGALLADLERPSEPPSRLCRLLRRSGGARSRGGAGQAP